MEILGYFASILIGISLGLMGGGGSILTVPVLVYLFGVDAVAATAYSLFIVGATSTLGSISYFKNKLVNLKTAVMFGLPSIISVLLTRNYVVPAIPKEIITIGDFVLTKSILMMLLFAVVMIGASYSMIKKRENSPQNKADQKFNYLFILIQGVFVGVFSGLVGAGGGFLIIPALVILFKLPMKEAVGTSLVIIAANSLFGFFASNHEALIDWKLLFSVSAFAVLGIFIGALLAKKIDGAKLKPAFGWFVLVMGIYIIIKETLLK